MKNGNNLAGDETLYHQYLCGDDTGLDALMKRYGDPLTLYIDGNLHDIHEAEELMIDVFADLFTKKPKIRDGGFKAYLYKTARHMALRRKSRRRFCLSLDELAAAPDARPLTEEVVRTAERNRVLHACMGDMNPDYREALYLTCFEGMSYAQAAEVTGKSVKQITNLVYRGKESLRKLLEREGVTDAESWRTVCRGEAAHCRKAAGEAAAAQQDRRDLRCGGVSCADRGDILHDARHCRKNPDRRLHRL